MEVFANSGATIHILTKLSKIISIFLYLKLPLGKFNHWGALALVVAVALAVEIA